MGPGHLAIGMAAKPVAPLWVLLTASEVPDLLFFGFQAAGIEYQGISTTDIALGITNISQGSHPWSHGLLMCIIWSV